MSNVLSGNHLEGHDIYTSQSGLMLFQITKNPKPNQKSPQKPNEIKMELS